MITYLTDSLDLDLFAVAILLSSLVATFAGAALFAAVR